MVYNRAARALDSLHFEVDSTESVWYSSHRHLREGEQILKLTPQSQYGISKLSREEKRSVF